MTGSVSSPGVGSKLDVKAIVDSLTAIEHKPIDVLAAHQKTVQAKLSSFGLVKNFMGNLKDAADRLADRALWTSTAATSSNAAAATVASKDGATPGSYRIDVEHLAQAQTLVSAPVADTRADLGAGTLRIELGAWSDDAGAFTPRADASATTISLPPAPSSLEAVRDRINAAKAGVTANILRDVNGARLVLRSNDTGAANAARITAGGADEGAAAPDGLAALAYDPPSNAGAMARAQPGHDAHATINGVPITTASNVLDGAVEGLTITLHKAGEASNLVVAADTSSMKKALAAFVGAYNDIAGYIAQQSAYDAAAKKAQPLQGDAATLQLQRQLRAALSDAGGSSAGLQRLVDVGIHLTADNTLALDDHDADAALARPQEMAKAFATKDAGDAKKNGFGVRFSRLAAAALDSDGLIGRRNQALQDSIARTQSRRDQMEDRVSQFQARLLKQYTALDATISTIDGQAAYVTQQIKLMQKTS